MKRKIAIFCLTFTVALGGSFNIRSNSIYADELSVSGIKDYSKPGIADELIRQNQTEVYLWEQTFIKEPTYNYTTNIVGIGYEQLDQHEIVYGSNGNELIKFSDGLAKITLAKIVYEGDSQYFENPKVGYIDGNGKRIVGFKYEDGTSFSDGVAAVKSNGKWGVIDKNGKQIAPFQYDDVTQISEGILTCSLNGKWGAIDKNGKIVIPFEYEMLYPKSEDLIGFKKGGKWGFINQQNKVVIPAKYEDVMNFKDGLGGYKLNNKWGFIDKNGKEIIPNEYEALGQFNEGQAQAKKDGKSGHIDKEGKIVIPFNYDYLGPLSDGMVVVGREVNITPYEGNEKLDGEVLELALWYDEQKENFYTEKFLNVDSGNEFDTYKQYIYGYLDKNGKEVIPMMYSSATDFCHGMAGISLSFGNYPVGYYIDKSNKKIQESAGIPLPFSEGYSISIEPILRSSLFYITKNPNHYQEENTLLTESDISVYLDDKKLKFDQNTIIENGHTLVPMRNIFEHLGAEISWNQATKTVTANKDDKEIKITVDSKNAKVNGSEYQLDVPARNVNGTVLVPLRFIGEQLDVSVVWEQNTKIVKLSTKN